MNTYAKFFEKHYEFYSRTIEWVSEQGTCEISPPDLACFRTEVKRLNTKHKPFAVFWPTPRRRRSSSTSGAASGVINVGGWHFNAQFNNALRPFHWDVFMDGTRTRATSPTTGARRCRGKNATLAGSTPTCRTKAQARHPDPGLPGHPREPRSTSTRWSPRQSEAPRPGRAEPVYTPSDIDAGPADAKPCVQKSSRGRHTLVIISDPINPVHHGGRDQPAVVPEHLLAGLGSSTTTCWAGSTPGAVAQRFGPGTSPSRAPERDRPSGGPADRRRARQRRRRADLRLHEPDLDRMIQTSAGRPQAAQRRARDASLPSSGGWEATKNPLAILIKYGRGDYTAIEDSRHTFWDPNATSRIDGRPGAYVALEGGRRFEIGKWPTGEPRR
jgi:hypothetical protein